MKIVIALVWSIIALPCIIIATEKKSPIPTITVDQAHSLFYYKNRAQHKFSKSTPGFVHRETTFFHEIRYSRDGLKDETPMVPVYIQDLPYKAKDLSFSDASFDTKDSVIKGVNINEVETPTQIIASWYDTVPVTVLKAAGLFTAEAFTLQIYHLNGFTNTQEVQFASKPFRQQVEKGLAKLMLDNL